MNVFDEVIAGVLERDPRYHRDSYLFAQEVFDHALEMRTAAEKRSERSRASRHLTGAELCEALRDMAFSRFGMLARAVLADWGIQATRDFGNIVFNLIEAGAMRKHEDDRVDYSGLKGAVRPRD